jgi:hypothetical protein
MRQAPDPPRSLSELSRRALAHADWADDAKPQERSLSALFSKIDRGLELEWLADRPVVQQVLSQVLGAPRSRIAEAVGAAPSAESTPRRVRLEDVPYAAAIDLTEERLPPGIPESVTRPAEWSPLWWIAPSGSGRSLVAAWLSARGIATCITAASWTEALAVLPATGPVFVELLAHEGPCPKPPRRELCVAAPGNPEAASRAAWNVVSSPAPTEWLDALVKWLARRLPRDGHFTSEDALAWLESERSRGFIDGFGTALGLAGLVDRYGGKELARSGLPRIVARFVRESIARTSDKGGPDATFLEDNATDILRLLARGLFTDSKAAWSAPRSTDEWVALVPAAYQKGLDAEWVQGSMSKRGRAPTVDELERSMRDLPPGGFRVVQTLERAGILRRRGADSFALGPRWLSRWLEEDALSTIVELTPESWGEALLLAPGAPAVARGIVDHALVGDTSIYDDVLDDGAAGDDDVDEPKTPRRELPGPASVAATEMAFRAAGIAVLVRGDVPDDVLLALWERQLESVVDRDDGPHPCIGYAEGPVLAEPLLEVGIFRLAALALSECLPAKHGSPHPLLRPWTAPPSAESFRPILDSMHRALARFDVAKVPWALEGYALGQRLHALFADQAATLAPHPLAWPGRMAAHVEQGSLEWSDFRVGADESGLRALFLLASRVHASEASVARAVWLGFCAAQERIDGDSPLWPAAPLGDVFWKHVPTAALATVMAKGLIDPRALPFSTLDADQWRALFDANPESLAGVGPALAVMPPALVRDAVARVPFRVEDLAALWSRDEAALLDAVVDLARRGSARLTTLLASAPDARTEAVAARLSAELHRRPSGDERAPLRVSGSPAGSGTAGFSFAALAAIREFLHERVRARSPGFRQAFELLRELG